MSTIGPIYTKLMVQLHHIGIGKEKSVNENRMALIQESQIHEMHYI